MITGFIIGHMVCLAAALAFALCATGTTGSKVYDAGYYDPPRTITSPDGKFFVRNYEGEGAVPYLDVFKAGKRRQRFASFSDVTTFVWAGPAHTLLLGTETYYGVGLAYEWSGERLPIDDGDLGQDDARVIYRPPWSMDSDDFETRILDVDNRTGTVRIRVARQNDAGDFTTSPRIVLVRYLRKRLPRR